MKLIHPNLLFEAPLSRPSDTLSPSDGERDGVRGNLRISNVASSSRRSAFTLVEVLAALVFMAIVIPTAVHGLQIANRAGQLGLRKTAAARIADRVMSEMMVTGQLRSGTGSGVVQEGAQQYHWMLRTDMWPVVNTMRVVTVQVTFPLQGREYDVRLSTLIDSSL